MVYGMGNDYRYLIDDDCEGKVVVCDRKIKNNRMKGDIEYITINTLLSKYKDTPIYVTSTRYGNEIRNPDCPAGKRGLYFRAGALQSFSRIQDSGLESDEAVAGRGVYH